jgi:hypothetical protein
MLEFVFPTHTNAAGLLFGVRRWLGLCFEIRSQDYSIDANVVKLGNEDNNACVGADLGEPALGRALRAGEVRASSKLVANVTKSTTHHSETWPRTIWCRREVSCPI